MATVMEPVPWLCSSTPTATKATNQQPSKQKPSGLRLQFLIAKKKKKLFQL